MKNIEAQPIDVLDLLDYYNMNNSTFTTFFDPKERQMKKRPLSTYSNTLPLPTDTAPSEINAYDLVEFFIKDKVSRDDNSHFVLDEVPIFQHKGICILISSINYRYYNGN